MSNALYNLGILAAAGNSATSAPANTESIPPQAVHVMTWLVAIGILVLAVWIFRRLANPAKLSLANSPGRPNSINPAHIILFVAFWMTMMFIMTSLAMKFLPLEESKQKLLAVIAWQLPCLAGLLVLAKFTFKFGLGRGLGLTLRHWLYDTLRAVLGYFAVFPICIGLWLLATYLIDFLLDGYPELHRYFLQEHELLSVLDTLSLPWKSLVIISAVVLAPLTEEIFFRGMVQSGLRKLFKSPWTAVIFSSAFFALVHIPYWRSMPALFALSVAIGYNYERCGRIYPAILMHAIFNAAQITIWLYAS